MFYMHSTSLYYFNFLIRLSHLLPGLHLQGFFHLRPENFISLIKGRIILGRSIRFRIHNYPVQDDSAQK